MLEAAFTSDGYTKHLVEPVRESVGTYMGEAVLAQESGQKWISPRWEALIGAVKESEVTPERWPKLVKGKREHDDSLEGIDFLNSIYIGLDGGTPATCSGLRYSGRGFRGGDRGGRRRGRVNRRFVDNFVEGRIEVFGSGVDSSVRVL